VISRPALEISHVAPTWHNHALFAAACRARRADIHRLPEDPSSMNLLDFFISPAFAQAAGQQPPVWQLPVMLGLFFVVFYFFVLRPQSKRAKEHRAMIAALAKGDEVVTAGGVLGRVAEIGDAFISIEVSNNVIIKLQRQAITAVLPKGTLKSA
jgi:preprotein translocase subunit YajC